MFKLNYPKFWNKIGIISVLLYPLSLVYKLISKIRKELITPKKINFPVICIGNATVGGTGKTILIKELAKHYLKNKYTVLIITKGYGGNFVKPTFVEPNHPISLAGDESLEIAKYLFDQGDVYILLAKDPVDAIFEIESINPDIILLDDGMQNPSISKDLNILTVDGSRCFGNKLLFPAGPLREDYTIAIYRSDIIVSINPLEYTKNFLREFSKNTPEFLKAEIFLENAKEIQAKSKYFIFCGVGNPERFESWINKQYDIVGSKFFQDHHKYTKQDIEKINKEAINSGAEIIITTNKDYVKISEADFSLPIKVASISIDKHDMSNLIYQIESKLNISHKK